MIKDFNMEKYYYNILMQIYFINIRTYIIIFEKIRKFLLNMIKINKNHRPKHNFIRIIFRFYILNSSKFIYNRCENFFAREYHLKRSISHIKIKIFLC